MNIERFIDLAHGKEEKTAVRLIKTVTLPEGASVAVETSSKSGSVYLYFYCAEPLDDDHVNLCVRIANHDNFACISHVDATIRVDGWTAKEITAQIKEVAAELNAFIGA